jgi:deoxyribonuclease-4
MFKKGIRVSGSIRFGTVGAPSSTPASGTVAAIQHTKALGLEHLEIAWVQSVSVTDKTCAEIKAAAEEYGISLSIHAPYFINLNSQTPEKMANSDARLIKAAQKGFLAGAKDIVFHPASYHGKPPEDVYPIVRDQLAMLADKLKKEGVAVTLRPETMGRVALFGSLEECVQLAKDVEGVKPCIDWAHLHARRTDGSFNSYEEFAGALAYVRDQLGEDALQTVHFHLSGIAYTDKGEKMHLPLNEADLRYRDLLQAFVDFGVSGTAGVEAPDPFHVEDALVFQATYKRLNGFAITDSED